MTSSRDQQAEPAADFRPLVAQPATALSRTESLCPYCAARLPADSEACSFCKGPLDALSRQATQNAMGPWQALLSSEPHARSRPGCSLDTLARLVARGRIAADTPVRGPTTRQFWLPARRVPGVAVLLGLCHACGCALEIDARACPSCQAELRPTTDRQSLGLAPVRPLPGEAEPHVVANTALATAAQPPTPSERERVDHAAETSGAHALVALRDARDRARRLKRTVIVLLAVVALLLAALVATFLALDGPRQMLGPGYGFRLPWTEDDTPANANATRRTAADSDTSPATDAQPPVAPMRGGPDAPEDGAPSPAGDAESARVVEVALDVRPELEPWFSDIEHAWQLETERGNDAEAVAEALETLTRVRREAGERVEAADEFPRLDARIRRLRERLNRLRAEALIAPPVS